MKKNANHVLFISRWYPSDTDAMLGLFVKNHAKAAASAGYKVTVAYASATSLELKKRLKTTVITDEGVTEVITYYSVSNSFGFLHQLIAWYKSISTAIKIQGRPSLVHAHILTRVGFLAMLVAWRYRINYIVTEHWSRYFKENLSYKGFFLKVFTNLVIKNAAMVTVVSNRLYKAMKEQGLSFMPVILPNAIDTSMFHIIDKGAGNFRFISITCFEEKSKNLKTIIDSTGELQNSGLDFELIMVGNGTDKQMIEKYAADKNVRVNFTGTLSPAETAIQLKSSNCLLLTSNYETFGIVAYEALASGVPVISTDVADLKEVVDVQSGIILSENSQPSLTMAMRNMLTQHSKYDPQHLRKRVIETCSISSISNQLRTIYQDVIGN